MNTCYFYKGVQSMSFQHRGSSSEHMAAQTLNQKTLVNLKWHRRNQRIIKHQTQHDSLFIICGCLWTSELIFVGNPSNSCCRRLTVLAEKDHSSSAGLKLRHMTQNPLSQQDLRLTRVVFASRQRLKTQKIEFCLLRLLSLHTQAFCHYLSMLAFVPAVLFLLPHPSHNSLLTLHCSVFFLPLCRWLTLTSRILDDKP